MNNANISTEFNGRKRLVLTFTFFSMFFGAGNLIFPPMLGAEAGRMTLVGTLGFIVSAVGLPILAVLMVTGAGSFENLATRVSPRFAKVLGIVIILAIGPCCAIPRTATTAFEMMVVPFVGQSYLWILRILFSLIFFFLSFLLSQRPEMLSKTLGRITTPLLLVLIVALLVACLVEPHSITANPIGAYRHQQLIHGFVDGYQTMDLLAALFFGIVISANAQQMGLDDNHNRHETGLAGLGAGALLIVVYGILSFMGAYSTSYQAIDPSTDNGATVLTNLTKRLFGPWGTAFVGIIFVLACFNVCTGLIATCSSYFSDQIPSVAGHNTGYRTWNIVFVLFSFLFSIAGLSTIITVSVPVLGALYPIAMVLVLLSLVHSAFSRKFSRVYLWTVLFVSIYSICNCLFQLAQVFGFSSRILESFFQSLPLYTAQLTWLIPAAAGLAIGIVDSLIRQKPRKPESEGQPHQR